MQQGVGAGLQNQNHSVDQFHAQMGALEQQRLWWEHQQWQMRALAPPSPPPYYQAAGHDADEPRPKDCHSWNQGC
jgi:hypothetical protein